MNMSEKRFRKIVTRLHTSDEGWVVLKEKQHEAWIAMEDDLDDVFKLSILTNETNRFQQLEPTLSDSVITQFARIEEESREIELEFVWNDQSICLRMVIDKIDTTNQIATYFFTPEYNSNEYVLFTDLPLSDNMKRDLRRIYKHFIEIVSTMPEHRLHFATRDITFWDVEGFQWLEGEGR